MNRTQIFKVNIFIGIIAITLFFVSCAKHHEYEGIFPPSNKALSSYRKIVIQNSKPDQMTHNLLENALKTKLTSIEPGNVNSTKSIKQIDNEISLFNYQPKVDQTSEMKIAYLSFDLQDQVSISRTRGRQTVTLKRCNYLLELTPCFPAGTATVTKGKQVLSLSLKGSIYLKNANGKNIIPPYKINVRKGDSGQLISSALKVMTDSINDIAYQFTKKVIPHKEKIKSEIMRDGDAVSIKLILNGAYNTAANRLSHLISKTDEPELSDLYNLGVTYEALTEVVSAAEYYQRAHELESDNDIVNIALKRIRRVVKE